MRSSNMMNMEAYNMSSQKTDEQSVQDDDISQTVANIKTEAIDSEMERFHSNIEMESLSTEEKKQENVAMDEEKMSVQSSDVVGEDGGFKNMHVNIPDEMSLPVIVNVKSLKSETPDTSEFSPPVSFESTGINESSDISSAEKPATELLHQLLLNSLQSSPDEMGVNSESKLHNPRTINDHSRKIGKVSIRSVSSKYPPAQSPVTSNIRLVCSVNNESTKPMCQSNVIPDNTGMGMDTSLPKSKIEALTNSDLIQTQSTGNSSAGNQNLRLVPLSYESTEKSENQSGKRFKLDLKRTSNIHLAVVDSNRQNLHQQNLPRNINITENSPRLDFNSQQQKQDRIIPIRPGTMTQKQGSITKLVPIRPANKLQLTNSSQLALNRPGSVVMLPRGPRLPSPNKCVPIRPALHVQHPSTVRLPIRTNVKQVQKCTILRFNRSDQMSPVLGNVIENIKTTFINQNQFLQKNVTNNSSSSRTLMKSNIQGNQLQTSTIRYDRELHSGGIHNQDIKTNFINQDQLLHKNGTNNSSYSGTGMKSNIHGDRLQTSTTGYEGELHTGGNHNKGMDLSDGMPIIMKHVSRNGDIKTIMTTWTGRGNDQHLASRDQGVRRKKGQSKVQPSKKLKKIPLTKKAITVDLTSGSIPSICIECDQSLSSTYHSVLKICDLCSFSTICSVSLCSHLKFKHGMKLKTPEELTSGYGFLAEGLLPEWMICECRVYWSQNPYQMADHLSECTSGQRTCRIKSYVPEYLEQEEMDFPTMYIKSEIITEEFNDNPASVEAVAELSGTVDQDQDNQKEEAEKPTLNQEQNWFPGDIVSGKVPHIPFWPSKVFDEANPGMETKKHVEGKINEVQADDEFSGSEERKQQKQNEDSDDVSLCLEVFQDDKEVDPQTFEMFHESDDDSSNKNDLMSEEETGQDDLSFGLGPRTNKNSNKCVCCFNLVEPSNSLKKVNKDISKYLQRKYQITATDNSVICNECQRAYTQDCLLTYLNKSQPRQEDNNPDFQNQSVSKKNLSLTTQHEGVTVKQEDTESVSIEYEIEAGQIDDLSKDKTQNNDTPDDTLLCLEVFKDDGEVSQQSTESHNEIADDNYSMPEEETGQGDLSDDVVNENLKTEERQDTIKQEETDLYESVTNECKSDETSLPLEVCHDGDEIFLTKAINDSADEDDRKSDETGKDGKSHDLVPLSKKKRYSCVCCSKRVRHRDRRKVNEKIFKYLQREYLITATENSVICNKCRHMYYRNLSIETHIEQQAKQIDRNDGVQVPSISRTSINLRAEEQEKSNECKADETSLPLEVFRDREEMFLTHTINDSADEDDRNSDETGKDGKSHDPVPLSKKKRCSCVCCSKRVRHRDRRKISAEIIKYLQREYLITANENSVICNKCMDMCYKNLSIEIFHIEQQAKQTDSHDGVPSISRTYINLRTEEQEKSNECKTDDTSLPLKVFREGDEMFLAHTIHDSADEHDRKSDKTGEDNQSHNPLSLTEEKYLNCVWCSKRIQPRDRCKVNEGIIKYLRRQYRIYAAENSVICFNCLDIFNKHRSVEAIIGQQPKQIDSNDEVQVPSITRTYINLRPEQQEKSKILKIALSKKQYRAQAGTTVKIECSLYTSNTNLHTVWWEKNVNGIKSIISAYKNSVKFKGIKINEPSLEIRNVDYSDAGSYKCFVSAGNITAESDTCSLEVLYGKATPALEDINTNTIKDECLGKKIPVISVPETKYSTDIGGTVTLKCNITSYQPINYIYWLHGRQAGGKTEIVFPKLKYIVYDAENPSLTLHNAKESDGGTYYCQAVNKSGSGRSAAIRLKVFKDKVPVVEKVKDSYSTNYGDSVTLECRIISDKPVSKVTWWKFVDGILESVNAENCFLKFNDTTKSTSLKILKAGQGDIGAYTCVATNSSGEGRSNPIILYVIKSEAAPIITVKNTTYTVHPSRNVTLRCDITSDDPLTSVRWLKYSQGFSTVIESGLQSEKYSNVSPDNPSLTIFNMEPSDAGKYICLASNTTGSSQSQSITVKTSSQLPLLTIGNAKYTVNTGSSVTLKCNITSEKPMVAVWWLKHTDSETTIINSTFQSKKFSDVSPNDPSLTISNVDPSDAGTYTCFATNTLGEGHSSTITVEILLQKVPVVTVKKTKYIVNAGYSVTLRCDIQSYSPVSTVWWEKNTDDVTIVINSKYNWEKYSGFSVHEPSLTILNINPSDEGTYTCFASNDVGDSQSLGVTVEVNAQKVPLVTMTKTKYAVIANDSVTLDCCINSCSPVLSIWWLKSYHNIATIINSKFSTEKYSDVSAENPSLTIHNVDSTDAGTYTCFASNMDGQGQGSAVTVEITVQKVPVVKIFKDNYIVKQGNPVIIECIVISDQPVSKVSWWKHVDGILESVNPEKCIWKFTDCTRTDPSLTIIKADLSDAGTYTCIATNDAGQGCSNATHLTVIKQELPVVTLEKLRYEVKPGDTVNLQCSIASDSLISSVWWLKCSGGVASIINSMVGSIKYNQISPFQPSLTIFDVDSTDAGKYTCFATNVTGEGHSSDVKVHVTSGCLPMVTLRKLNYVVQAGVAVTIQCNITSDSLISSVWWLKCSGGVTTTIDSKHCSKKYRVSPLEPSLTIFNVDSTDAGKYTCFATNDTGEGCSSKVTVLVILQIKTLTDGSKINNAAVNQLAGIPNSNQPTNQSAPNSSLQVDQVARAPNSSQPVNQLVGAPSNSQPVDQFEGAPINSQSVNQSAPNSSLPVEQVTRAPNSSQPANQLAGAPSSSQPANQLAGAPSSIQPVDHFAGAPSSSQPANQLAGALSSIQPVDHFAEDPSSGQSVDHFAEDPSSSQSVDQVSEVQKDNVKKTESLYRFAKVDSGEIQKLVDRTSLKNIKRITYRAVHQFRNFLMSKNMSRKFEVYSKTNLDNALSSFYLEMHKLKLKQVTILDLRDGIQRRLLGVGFRVDILNEGEFPKSTEALKEIERLTTTKLQPLFCNQNSLHLKLSAVKLFCEYLTSKKMSAEFEIYTNEELDNALASFYVEMRNKKGEIYNRNTTVGYKLGIQRHLRECGRDVDLTRGDEFQKSAMVFKGIGIEMKNKSLNFSMFQSITADDMDKIYNYVSSDLENALILQYKVFIDVMFHFGSKRASERYMVDLNWKDFALTETPEGNQYVYLTTNKTGKEKKKSSEGKMYAVAGYDRCPVKSFMKYVDRLNPSCSQLFQQPREYSKDGVFYDNVHLGRTKMGSLMAEISTNAGLTTIYHYWSCKRTPVHIYHAVHVKHLDHEEKCPPNTKESVLQGSNEDQQSAMVYKGIGIEMKNQRLIFPEYHSLTAEVHSITAEDMEKIYNYVSSDLENAQILQYKVFIDVMFHFGSRIGSERNLVNLNWKDFVLTETSEGNQYVYLTLTDKKKNKFTEGKMYAIPGHDRCPVKSFKKYVDRLNPGCSQMFQRSRKYTKGGVYYDNVKLGKIKMGRLMKEISTNAGLTTIYHQWSCKTTPKHIYHAEQVKDHGEKHPDRDHSEKHPTNTKESGLQGPESEHLTEFYRIAGTESTDSSVERPWDLGSDNSDSPDNLSDVDFDNLKDPCSLPWDLESVYSDSSDHDYSPDNESADLQDSLSFEMKNAEQQAVIKSENETEMEKPLSEMNTE